MRAGRLVALMLILQRRGRTTAAQLSDEPEVSQRTIPAQHRGNSPEPECPSTPFADQEAGSKSSTGSTTACQTRRDGHRQIDGHGEHGVPRSAFHPKAANSPQSCSSYNRYESHEAQRPDPSNVPDRNPRRSHHRRALVVLLRRSPRTPRTTNPSRRTTPPRCSPVPDLTATTDQNNNTLPPLMS